MTPKPVDRPAGIHHAGKVSLTMRKAVVERELAGVLWPGPSSGPTTVTGAVIFDAAPRSWFDRLFSLPWRPWRKYREPVVVQLSEEGSDG